MYGYSLCMASRWDWVSDKAKEVLKEVNKLVFQVAVDQLLDSMIFLATSWEPLLLLLINFCVSFCPLELSTRTLEQSKSSNVCNTHTCTDMYTHIWHTRARARTHTHAQSTHIHAHMHTHTFTCTHKHTQTYPQLYCTYNYLAVHIAIHVTLVI